MCTGCAMGYSDLLNTFTVKNLLYSCCGPTGIIYNRVIQYNTKSKKYAVWQKNKSTLVTKKIKDNPIFLEHIPSV